VLHKIKSNKVKTVGVAHTHKLFAKSLTKNLIKKFFIFMKGQGMKSLVGVWGGKPQGLKKRGDTNVGTGRAAARVGALSAKVEGNGGFTLTSPI